MRPHPVCLWQTTLGKTGAIFIPRAEVWKLGEAWMHVGGACVPDSEGLNPLGMHLKDGNRPHCWMRRGVSGGWRGPCSRMEPRGSIISHRFPEEHHFKEQAVGFEVFAWPSVQSAVPAGGPYDARLPSSGDLQAGYRQSRAHEN